MNGKPKPVELCSEFISDKTLLAHIQATETGFPCCQLQIDELIAEGDLIASRARMQGVHEGTFMGVPATGRRIDVPIFVTYRIAGGKIVDHWMVTDTLLLMQQLGLVPAPA